MSLLRRRMILDAGKVAIGIVAIRSKIPEAQNLSLTETNNIPDNFTSGYSKEEIAYGD